MSGEVVLLDDADGSITRLVRTASLLFDRKDLGPAALVGGLAVTIRLATVHRVTNDVDAVADDESLSVVADDSERIVIDGVTVDVIRTSALPNRAEDLPYDELDRLFVLAHRWALEAAERVAVRVATTKSDGALHSVVVAPARALVACKFRAIAGRRGARLEKREGDALDLVRLISDLVRAPDSAKAFVAAPFDLAALVALQTKRWLIEDSIRMARLINMRAGSDHSADPANIATIGELFVEMLA